MMLHWLVILSTLAFADMSLSRYIAKFRVAADRFYPFATLTGSGALPKERFKDITIQLGAVSSEDRAAECNPHTLVITVSLAVWEVYDEWDKEELIFHELGHCVLKRKHTTAMHGDIPASIMYPYVLPEAVYLLNRDYYLQELFTP